jgi:hypothetical protein
MYLFSEYIFDVLYCILNVNMNQHMTDFVTADKQSSKSFQGSSVTEKVQTNLFIKLFYVHEQ